MKNKEKNKRLFNSNRSIFPKSRQGIFLAEETLKIVIAVIVIGFLVFFIVSLYLSTGGDEEMKFAESSVNYIMEQMNLQSREILIFNPEGWFVSAWTKNTGLPLTCSNLNWDNCICICEESTSKSCDEDGYCKNYNKEIFIKEGSVEINNPPITLQLNYGEKIEVNKK
ncbi:MAG: hypothetical protein WD876_02160 [Candidatus Pacearchaeota archaeon]